MKDFYCRHNTQKGDIFIVYDKNGVKQVFLPYDEFTGFDELEYKEDEKIKKYFDDYFSGKDIENIDLNINITQFQKKVFDILLNTKRGTLVTYSDIAALIGCGSSQAVGQALKKNPVPILIPCHRVVGKGWDGGFAGETSGPKMEYKKYLIDFERNNK